MFAFVYLSGCLSFRSVCLSICQSAFHSLYSCLPNTTLSSQLSWLLFTFFSTHLKVLPLCISVFHTFWHSHDCQSGYLPIPVTSKIFFLFSSEPNKGPLSELVSPFYGLKFFRMFLKFSFFVRRRKRSNSTIAIPEESLNFVYFMSVARSICIITEFAIVFGETH